MLHVREQGQGYSFTVGTRKEYTPRANGKEITPVTVCVAAICGNQTIFGAADRMLTAGDVQFEPPDIKIATVTNSIALMTAEDWALHTEILQSVRADINARLAIEPEEWIGVKYVAELYSEFYNQVRQKRAERAILAPFGLTTDTFLTRQTEMSPDFVRQLGTELINFNPGNIEAIITGIDNSGPHIWVVKNDETSCYDKAGFAAIGAGEWHAKSAFMFARYTRFRALPPALLLTYAAKKRAEVAPGVGGHTDMFTIGPQLGSFTWIRDEILQRLEEIYQWIRQEEETILLQANAEVDQYVQEIARAATSQEQAALPEDSGGHTPADQEQLRDDLEAGESETGRQEPPPS